MRESVGRQDNFDRLEVVFVVPIVGADFLVPERVLVALALVAVEDLEVAWHVDLHLQRVLDLKQRI